MNAMKNTISGAITFANRHRKPSPLAPGPACDLGGFVGQLSSQAIDLNILVISLVVLSVVREKNFVAEPSKVKAALLCLVIWIPPLITSV
jgi:hypothetical protein